MLLEHVELEVQNDLQACNALRAEPFWPGHRVSSLSTCAPSLTSELALHSSVVYSAAPVLPSQERVYGILHYTPLESVEGLSWKSSIPKRYLPSRE